MVNRVPNSWLLTNKVGLLTSLQRYDRIRFLTGNMSSTTSASFLPETYRVDLQNERARFLDKYEENRMLTLGS